MIILLKLLILYQEMSPRSKSFSRLGLLKTNSVNFCKFALSGDFCLSVNSL